VSQAIRSLPQDMLTTSFKADANSDIISTVQSDVNQPVSDYENVISTIRNHSGVSGVQIWGQKRYAMRLWIDPVKLASYGCTVAEVEQL
jgi:HAE1 family hydrophobic/amphiphilic exporter-1/multidrug efflux pump